MTVLLLRLAGPLQAWGDSSRFVRRETRPEPTKSGVLGMLAAAQGRLRVDEIVDLAALKFGVRVDQRGRLERDFQTAIRWTDGESMPLSYRFYIADAVYVAGVEGDPELLAGLDDALRSPAFPLYLGRRSCPPTLPVSLGLCDGELLDALRAEKWHAARWYRTTQDEEVRLPIYRDARDADEDGVVVRDEPVSFDPRRRQYSWRTVVHRREEDVVLANPESARAPRADAAGAAAPVDVEHDPLDLAESANR